MELLSNYDDETSNTSNRSTTADPVVIMNSGQRTGTSGRLQSEWESFEKMIESSSPPDGSKTLKTDSEIPKLGPEDNLKPIPLETQKVTQVSSTVCPDDDESHLPPGVRKKNRCHSSSSSSDDDDDLKRKSHSNTDMSCSDSEDSVKSSKSSKTFKSDGHEGKEKLDAHKSPPKLEIEGKVSEKRAKRSRSKSRSRSHSPHSKRRRSSERSRHSRSRSRSRHRRKEKKHRSHRSRSKERRRSKERDHYRSSRHKDRRHSRSRSRSRDRRDKRRPFKSRDSERVHRSRSRSRSRSRGRRNSPSPRGAKVIKYGDKVIKAGASFGRPPPSKPMTFKEKMRQQLIKAMEEGGDVTQALMSKDGTVMCTQTAGTQQMPVPKKPPVPLMANIVTSTAGLTAATITASEAAMQSMLALQKETTEKTGVEIPKYYNPAAINPVKYAEQVQKRKLLWSKTKEKEVNSQWHATTLSSDHDDRSKEKFRKLMGIKQEGSSSAGDDEEKISVELEQKQKELFEKLDKEYQYARMATHTHRGIGLGFGSNTYPPPGT